MNIEQLEGHLGRCFWIPLETVFQGFSLEATEQMVQPLLDPDVLVFQFWFAALGSTRRVRDLCGLLPFINRSL